MKLFNRSLVDPNKHYPLYYVIGTGKNKSYQYIGTVKQSKELQFSISNINYTWIKKSDIKQIYRYLCGFLPVKIVEYFIVEA